MPGHYIVSNNMHKDQTALIANLLGTWFEEADKKNLFISEEETEELESHDEKLNEIIKNHDLGRYTILFNASVINLDMKDAIPKCLKNQVDFIFKLYRIRYINISLSNMDSVEIVHFLTNNMDKVLTLGVY